MITKDDKINALLSIEDDSEFWKKICEYWTEEGKEGIGFLVEKQMKSIDFSDKNIRLLSKLTKGYEKIITPSYFSKLCPTTGLFIFLVKESFEYCGALIDRKTSIARQFKNFNYNSDFVKGNIEKVTKILSVLN